MRFIQPPEVRQKTKTRNQSFTFTPLFPAPMMQVQLDLDLEKLTEFVFQLQREDSEGVILSNVGGWQSNPILEEKHEEFVRLKREITQYLEIYHLKIYQEMVFKENVTQNIKDIWVNINEKYHYNDWHIHGSNLSGIYYIKHDGSNENGNLTFKHPIHHWQYIMRSHWPYELIEEYNEATSEYIDITPKSNMLLIFPSWLEHKAENNLKDDTRISLSFNSDLILEKK